MTLAGHVFIWEEDGRLHSRISTNASESLLRKKLRQLDAERFIENIERHEDPLRLGGGGYVLVRWCEGVEREWLKALLAKV